jgi:hypothetical protein
VAAGTSGEATVPADYTLVYLVRHGQTPLNESGVLRGLLDPPLDEAGHLQAGRLGAVLGPQMPSVIVASPLLRARQTAQPVADRAGRDVTTDGRLLDRDYGLWTGTDREAVVARWGYGGAGVRPRLWHRCRSPPCLPRRRCAFRPGEAVPPRKQETIRHQRSVVKWASPRTGT